MKRITFLLILLLLAALHTGQAQEAEPGGWQIVVYEDGSTRLTVLDKNGIKETLPFPSGLRAWAVSPVETRAAFDNPMALSPDRRFLAWIDKTPVEGGRLVIGDLRAQICCVIENVSAHPIGIVGLGGFSPDSKFLAVSFLALVDEAGGAFESALLVLDVMNGRVTARLDADRFGGDFAYTLGWDESGINFMPFCYACDRPPSGTISRWNPATDTVEANVGVYDGRANVLTLTGERVSLETRGDFPMPVGEWMIPPANVVTYTDGTTFPRAIYYDSRHIIVSGAWWVADGWSVLVRVGEDGRGAALIDRARMVRGLSGEAARGFIVGTPDGWLTQRTGETGGVEVYHHTLGNAEGSLIARFAQPVTVLEAPALGASASHGGFPGIDSPARIHCPLAPPTRLIVGRQGRPTAGSSSNLRSLPSTAGEVIAVIPGDATFTVVGGPSCDRTGIAWWEVEFAGRSGWIAEGRDDAYYVEPV